MSNYESLPPFQLNADLMDCLLTTLPDFQSLQSFISTSKFVYSVFRGRQNSILRAVARNQFGSTLPQAMHLVRYLDGDHELQREVDFAQESTITSAQACLLRNHAVIVQTLEDIYSWREKDPRSRSSRLSAGESLRFQQSIYRFWLLAAACSPGLLVSEGQTDDNYENHLQLKRSIVGKQKTFLLSLELGEAELLGVDEVHSFLLDLARWALFKHTTKWSRSYLGCIDRDNAYLVWSGPAVIMDAFRGKWAFFPPISSLRYDILRAMSRAISVAEITGRAQYTALQHFVLDDHFFETINCSQCQGLRYRGRSIWSICNWEYMSLVISPSSLRDLLAAENRRPLHWLVSFTEAAGSIPYPQLIEEIFDMRSKRYKKWNKDDWLCTQCMIGLLLDNIQTWFDARAAERMVDL